MFFFLVFRFSFRFFFLVLFSCFFFLFIVFFSFFLFSFFIFCFSSYSRTFYFFTLFLFSFYQLFSVISLIAVCFHSFFFTLHSSLLFYPYHFSYSFHYSFLLFVILFTFFTSFLFYSFYHYLFTPFIITCLPLSSFFFTLPVISLNYVCLRSSISLPSHSFSLRGYASSLAPPKSKVGPRERLTPFHVVESSAFAESIPGGASLINRRSWMPPLNTRGTSGVFLWAF